MGTRNDARWMLLLVLGFCAPLALSQEEPETSSEPGQAAPSPEDSSQGEDESRELRARWPEAPADARFTEEGWFAPRERLAPLPEVPETVTKAFVIPIYGVIDGNLYDAVRRKSLKARAAGAELIVLEFDTPGGLVSKMDEISLLLTEDLSDVRTVALVKQEAISAGAVIAMSCDEIYMQPGTEMGDAMPIMMAPGGGVQPLPAAEREKTETYLRTKVRSLAELHGYDPNMAQSMVTLKEEVWLIRHKDTGKLEFLRPGELQTRADREGVPTLEQELEKEGKEFLRIVDRDDQLLTMTATEARRYGFCKEIIPGRDALAEEFNVQGPMVFMEDTTEEKLAAFLTSPAITGLLVLIGIGAIYVEFNTPGLGIPAAVALAAFSVLIGSHFMLGLALWWEVLLFVVGIILIGLEIFVIPGFGIAGISGITLCVMSLLAMMIPNAPLEFPWPRTTMMWTYFRRGGISLTIGFLGSVTLVVLLSRILPKSPLANKLFLGPAKGADTPPSTDEHPIRRIELGQSGVAATTCRPVGQVRIDGMLLDAVADGTMIPRGAKVRVLRKDGNRLLVEEDTEA